MELVKNSLDADFNSISVVVKDGGVKLIQFSEDCLGIRVRFLHLRVPRLYIFRSNSNL